MRNARFLRHTRGGMDASRASANSGLIAPASAQRIETPRGSIAYWELRRNVYVTEVRGYLSRDMAQLIMDRADALYRPDTKVHGFHNWFAMDNYESSSRVDL